MHLQRADAGRQVDDAIQHAGAHGGVQRVDAHAQRDVQLHRAQLHEHVPVTGLADHQAGAARSGRPLQQDGRRFAGAVEAHRRRRVQCLDPGVLAHLQRCRVGLRDAAEADAVARPQLSELPALGGDDHRGAHEAAQAGAVGAEDHRHVAREVDGADGVGVVVDVGGMQAGLAAVAPCPLRLRPDQAHPRAAGVVVHLPGRGEEGVDVGRGEEVGRAVRAVQHGDVPLAAFGDVLRHGTCIQRQGGEHRGLVAQVQHVARAQRASGVAAELAQREGGAAAEVGRYIDAATHCQVAAASTAGSRAADAQHAAGFDRVRLPRRERASVQRDRHRRAAQGDDGRVMEAQGRT